MRLPLSISSGVKAALANGLPVVALESTIITHGMPYPQNLVTARRVEQVVRENGAEPATIAVLNGQLCVGLEDIQLEDLARSTGAVKLSRADLAIALATGRTGSTTVAATMIAAKLAGIAVFATGGIGGVHRGAETSFDISADLQELAQTPVTVIAAGAKAILDIPKTLEVLETLGVPVITFGQDDFPAFWARSSGLRSPQRLDDPSAIAASHLMRDALGLPGGQLVANPINVDDEIPLEQMEPLIARALSEAQSLNIAQKAVTPFLLGRIFELTAGRSLVANISLVKNNAGLAARIATEICKQNR
ncbi:MAG: pseudouridine-5'-phosphate glycosidase [Rhodobacterales bacterium]|jgi:pseudouridylate synthase|nr:pseudouridine-5'-phosphate glycosidase [Pseudomonadota bacterium]